MSDPQARAAEQLTGSTVRVQVVNVGTVTGFLRAESAAHVAAALAEAGLLADLETRRFGAIFDDLDAARAELTEVKAEREKWETRYRKVIGERNRETERAEKAEAELAALREGVRALAGEWETGGTFWQQRATDLRTLLGEES